MGVCKHPYHLVIHVSALKMFVQLKQRELINNMPEEKTSLNESKLIPVFGIILWPELAEMVKRRSDDREALRPHEFREEGGDASEAVARNTIGRTSRLELLVRWEGEEGVSNPVHVIKKAQGDTMVHHLERTPCLACMSYKL